jgi:uncharacterized protein YndB with AHSA1/START domain
MELQSARREEAPMIEMVERQVTLPAPRQDVWDALTEPDRVAAWFGGQVEWDLQPGGAARFHDEDGSERAGVIDTVATGQVLRFRWWPNGEGGPESEVTYTLEDVPDGTRLTVTEAPADGTESPARAQATACAVSGQAWDLRLIGMWLQAVAPVPALV